MRQCKIIIKYYMHCFCVRWCTQLKVMFSSIIPPRHTERYTHRPIYLLTYLQIYNIYMLLYLSYTRIHTYSLSLSLLHNHNTFLHTMKMKKYIGIKCFVVHAIVFFPYFCKLLLAALFRWKQKLSHRYETMYLNRGRGRSKRKSERIKGMHGTHWMMANSFAQHRLWWNKRVKRLADYNAQLSMHMTHGTAGSPERCTFFSLLSLVLNFTSCSLWLRSISSRFSCDGSWAMSSRKCNSRNI